MTTEPNSSVFGSYRISSQNGSKKLARMLPGMIENDVTVKKIPKNGPRIASASTYGINSQYKTMMGLSDTASVFSA